MNPTSIDPINVFDYSEPPTLNGPDLTNDLQQMVSNAIQNQGIANSVGGFAFNSIEDDNDFQTASASYVDITNMVLTFTLNRAAKVLILANALVYLAAGSAGASGMNIELDGTVLIASGLFSNITKGLQAATYTMQTLAQGPHTIKLQLACLGGATKAGVQDKILSYIVLGST